MKEKEFDEGKLGKRTLRRCCSTKMSGDQVEGIELSLEIQDCKRLSTISSHIKSWQRTVR